MKKPAEPTDVERAATLAWPVAVCHRGHSQREICLDLIGYSSYFSKIKHLGMGQKSRKHSDPQMVILTMNCNSFGGTQGLDTRWIQQIFRASTLNRWPSLSVPPALTCNVAWRNKTPEYVSRLQHIVFGLGHYADVENPHSRQTTVFPKNQDVLSTDPCDVVQQQPALSIHLKSWDSSNKHKHDTCEYRPQLSPGPTRMIWPTYFFHDQQRNAETQCPKY